MDDEGEVMITIGDELRQAALRIREMARRTPTAPWAVQEGGNGCRVEDMWGNAFASSEAYAESNLPHPVAEHIALWDPALTTLAADWLEQRAEELDNLADTSTRQAMEHWYASSIPVRLARRINSAVIGE